MMVADLFRELSLHTGASLEYADDAHAPGLSLQTNVDHSERSHHVIVTFPSSPHKLISTRK